MKIVMTDGIIRAMTQLHETHSTDDAFGYEILFVEEDEDGKATGAKIHTENIKSMIVVTSEGQRQIDPNALRILCVLKDEDNKNADTEGEKNG